MMPYDDEDDGAAAAFIDRMLSERARCDALLARFDDDIGGTGADAAAELASCRASLAEGREPSEALRAALAPGRVVRLPLRAGPVSSARARLEDVQRKLAADELSLRVESLHGYSHQTEGIWGGDELPSDVRNMGAELLLAIGEVQRARQGAERSLHSVQARAATPTAHQMASDCSRARARSAHFSQGGGAGDERAVCGARDR